MNKLLKIGLVGGLAGGIIYGAIKLFKMKKLSDNIISSLSNPRVHKVDWSGIVFRTEVKLQNPTKNDMVITKPVVTLSTNGNYITSNSPENKEFTVKPLGITNIDTVELVIGWTTLAGYVSGIVGKAPALIDAFKKKDLKSIAATLAIPLEMKYSLYANNIFYESPSQKIM